MPPRTKQQKDNTRCMSRIDVVSPPPPITPKMPSVNHSGYQHQQQQVRLPQGPGVQTLDRPPRLAVSGQDNYICSSKLPPGLQAWKLAKACSMHSYPLSVAPGRTTQTPELRMPLNFKWAGREQRKRRRGRQRPASGCKDWSLDNLMHPSICLGLWRHLLTVPSGTRELRKQ